MDDFDKLLTGIRNRLRTNSKLEQAKSYSNDISCLLNVIEEQRDQIFDLQAKIADPLRDKNRDICIKEIILSLQINKLIDSSNSFNDNDEDD